MSVKVILSVKVLHKDVCNVCRASAEWTPSNPSCPFESSAEQSHTLSISQVNSEDRVDFVIGISFLLDLSVA